jgi:AraC-like DNA-binding protein
MCETSVRVQLASILWSTPCLQCAKLVTALAFLFTRMDCVLHMKSPSTSPARYLHLLLRLLEQRDIDCDEAVTPLGVRRTQLAHPIAKLPTAPSIEVFRTLLAEHGDPAMGLELGRSLTIGEMGDLGLALLRCATIGEALRCAETHYSLVTPSFGLKVERRPEAVVMTWHPLHAMPYDFVMFCFDMALGAMDGLSSQLLGTSAPIADAYLTRARPQGSAYQQLKRIRCHFAQQGVPSLRLCMSPDLWDHPLPTGNADELAVLRERLQLRMRPVSVGAVAPWVEMMLRESVGEQPNHDFLAQVAGVSSSTLSRRLSEEGTTFRALANRVRHERACELLQNDEHSVADISALLGYADAPSFVRAFKAISGVTPGSMREGLSKGRRDQRLGAKKTGH